MPPALDPEAAGLIRAVLTRDRFAIDQILTHAFKSDVDGLYFASLVVACRRRLRRSLKACQSLGTFGCTRRMAGA